MAHRIDDARQWRARAEEARELAAQLTSAESKRIMVGIAVSYRALAQPAADSDAARRKDGRSAPASWHPVLEPVRFDCRGLEVLPVDRPSRCQAEHNGREAQASRLDGARSTADDRCDLIPGIIERIEDH